MPNDVGDYLLGVAVKHTSIICIEEGIIDARITRTFSTLHDDHVVCLVGV